jgi:hypothetical protein
MTLRHPWTLSKMSARAVKHSPDSDAPPSGPLVIEYADDAEVSIRQCREISNEGTCRNASADRRRSGKLKIIKQSISVLTEARKGRSVAERTRLGVLLYLPKLGIEFGIAGVQPVAINVRVNV